MGTLVAPRVHSRLEQGRTSLGREEAQVVKLPRERLRGFEVWGDLERKGNGHGSGNLVPLGSA